VPPIACCRQGYPGHHQHILKQSVFRNPRRDSGLHPHARQQNHQDVEESV
jgi:hypothetical protein